MKRVSQSRLAFTFEKAISRKSYEHRAEKKEMKPGTTELPNEIQKHSCFSQVKVKMLTNRYDPSKKSYNFTLFLYSLRLDECFRQ